jgi:hypothetical protein
VYVGTDDGNLWVTKSGGSEWTNITKNVGLPGPRYVATIEPSHFEEGRAYVAFDGHRSDDDNPLLYVTEDFGQTWKPLRANLPWGSTHCLREDTQNADLLFVGTEFAVWVSLDRGASWTKLNNNLPTVAVHDFAFHPTAGEIVAATHGRSLWILDVTALRQMTPEVLKAQVYLFKPNAAVRWHFEPNHGRTNRRFVGENPPFGAEIYYVLQKKAEKISLKILDFEGKTVRELQAGAEPGLHRVVWDLARSPTGRGAGRGASGPGGGPGGPGAAPGRRAGGRGPGASTQQAVPPGMYRVVLTADGQELSQALRLEAEFSSSSNLIAPSKNK